jgi:hypothetical protein
MRLLGPSIAAIAAATLLTASAALSSPAFADETAPEAGVATAAPVPAPADPALVPAPSAGETTSEVAPDSATGTVEEPAYSPMPSGGPGGGCHGRKVEMPSV